MRDVDIENLDSVNASRLKRYRAGETIRTISETDRVNVASVRSSIKQAKVQEHEDELIQFVRMKLEGRIRNEHRQNVIAENYPRVIKAIKGDWKESARSWK